MTTINAAATTIIEIEMPESYYEERRTIGGGTVRDVMPWPEAEAYVSDGEQWGVRYRGGQVDWMGDLGAIQEDIDEWQDDVRFREGLDWCNGE